MVAPRPKLGDCQRNSLTYSMLITHLLRIRLEGHRQPRKKVESLSSTEGTIGFESKTFRFGTQRLNPLHHLLQLTFWFLYNYYLQAHLPHKASAFVVDFQQSSSAVSIVRYIQVRIISASVFISILPKTEALFPCCIKSLFSQAGTTCFRILSVFQDIYSQYKRYKPSGTHTYKSIDLFHFPLLWFLN